MIGRGSMMGFMNKLFGKKTSPGSFQPDEVRAIGNAQNKVDVNKPVENPKLKDLLRKYKELPSNDILNEILRDVAMNAQLLSVVVFSKEPEQNKNGTATIKEGTNMQFPMFATQDKLPIYPAFTDWIELGKWQDLKSPQTLILSFDDYAAMVFHDEKIQGIVVNPFNDNLVINRPMIEHMKTQKDIITKGVSEQTVTKETEVLLGEPKNYPTEMVNAISNYLKDKTAVNRVWLRLMQRENEQSFLLVVDFSGDKSKTFPGIANAARPYLNKMYLDIVPYQEGFGKNAVENVTPFYRK